jgi:methylase of polypeptide subunit release factors
LIIANPPWIVASKIRNDDALENTVTDPDGIMLKSIFEFANRYL